MMIPTAIPAFPPALRSLLPTRGPSVVNGLEVGAAGASDLDVHTSVCVGVRAAMPLLCVGVVVGVAGVAGVIVVTGVWTGGFVVAGFDPVFEDKDFVLDDGF